MATIKGKWWFHQTLIEPGSVLAQAICFQLENGQSFTQIDPVSSSYVEYSTAGSTVDTVGAYAYGTSTWAYEVYRKIDFGDTEQEVSAEFYAWFTVNATKMADDTEKPIVTFDLSKLSLTGAHSITVRAKASGYADSAKSASVAYSMFKQVYPTYNTSTGCTVLQNMDKAKVYTIYVEKPYGTSIYALSYRNGGWRAYYLDNTLVCSELHNFFYSYLSGDAYVSFSIECGEDKMLYGATLEGTVFARLDTFASVTKANVYIGEEYRPCFAPDTPITLADGTEKAVQDVKYEDELLVWDFDNGCYSQAKPLWIKRVDISTFYHHLTFEDGSVLDLIGPRDRAHRLFCLDTNRFEYGNYCVGKRVMTENGPLLLVSSEIIENDVEYYNVITDYHMNIYANNVLTSTGLNNLYEIENMRYVKTERELIPIEAFDNIPEKYYCGLRLGEQVDYTIERINEKVRRLEKFAIENR